MNLEKVRSIARLQGVRAGKLVKDDLIRAIQLAEGNFACFATARNAECDQLACRWRDDCFDAALQGE